MSLDPWKYHALDIRLRLKEESDKLENLYVMTGKTDILNVIENLARIIDRLKKL